MRINLKLYPILSNAFELNWVIFRKIKAYVALKNVTNTKITFFKTIKHGIYGFKIVYIV